MASYIKKKVKQFVLGRILKEVVQAIDGRKTLIGAVNLLLWVAIYAIPAFTPEYNQITEYAVWIRDGLAESGLVLDNELFNIGVGFTLVGLVDKVRKLIKGK
jgi:hypothetical protein